MAVADIRDLYELLLRFGNGELAGAHALYIDRVVDLDTGRLIGETVSQAEPVTLEQAAALVGDQMAALLAQVSGQAAQIAEATERANAADAEVVRLNAANEGLAGQLTSQVTGNEVLAADLKAANERIEQLEIALAAANAQILDVR